MSAVEWVHAHADADTHTETDGRQSAKLFTDAIHNGVASVSEGTPLTQRRGKVTNEKYHTEGLERRSEVKSTDCSSRSPEFNS